MIDASWTTLVCAGLVVTLAYTVYGLTGFGAAIVAVPLLAQLFPLRFAVPMMLVFDLCTGLLLGMKNRQHLNRQELVRLAPFLLLGMAVGVLLLVKADERVLLGVLGGFVLSYALWSLVRRDTSGLISPRWAALAGTSGGAFTALYGTGGPIYMIYLTHRIEDKLVLRATIGVLIFCAALARLVLFTGTGLYAQPGLLTLAFALLPCAFTGYLIGSRLHAKFAPQRLTQAVLLLLIFSSSGLLYRSLWAP